jgi:hypothetical protein
MNQIIAILVVLALTLESTAAFAAEKPTEAPGKMIERPAMRATRTSAAKVPKSSLAKALVWEGVAIEKPSGFVWDGKICLLTTDNHGAVTGMRGRGALWVSDDGIHFKPEWTRLGFDRIPCYYANYDPARVKKIYGGDPKFERPKILCMDGHPAWLYAASGWNFTGGQRTENHVLRIHLKPSDGPLSALREH